MTNQQKIVRDDGLELGFISQVAYTPPSQYGAYQGSGSWLATLSTGHSKYFVNYNNAIKWLEKKHENILPISRLAEFLRRGLS